MLLPRYFGIFYTPYPAIFFALVQASLNDLYNTLEVTFHIPVLHKIIDP
jgi:hypothetical protein